MKGKRKQEKGITLIALVITIIVLLILAGVTLSIVMNTGIVDNSKKAVNTYNAQQAKDKLAMAIYNYRIAKYMNSEKGLEDLIAEVGGDAVLNEDTGEYEVYVDGYDFTVSENLEITSEEIAGEDPKPQYEVTISKNDGIKSTNTGRKLTQGKSMTIKAEVKDGYVFEKWKITNGKGEIKEETSITTTIKPSEDVTVEAIATAGKINNISGNTNNYTFTGEEKAYNNPIIPVGFVAVQTENAKWKSTDGQTVDDWNKGLVIADAQNDGNEFVWIPAYIEDTENEENNAEYEKNNVPKYENWSKKSIHNDVNDIEEVGIPEKVTNIWNQEEKNQVKTYEGFYIARYEAGIPESLTTALGEESANAEKRNIGDIAPLSKRNKTPWNYINWTNSKKNAELMKSSDYVQSGLITVKMWDSTLSWLILSGAISENEAMYDSRSWGNFQPSEVTQITEYSIDNGATWTGVSSTTKENVNWLLKTGHSNYTNRNNIFDLAGNLWEFTTGTYFPNLYIMCGGDRGNDGVIYGASAYGHRNEEYTSPNVGFRVALYLK